MLRVLKAQPLTLLHVFHHAAVLVMAHFWLRAAQSLQVLGLLANTGVHVLMYGYYLACSCGARPGRAVKQAVTGAQIVQFLFSLAASVPFLWLHSTRPGGCSGFDAWAANVAFNVLLLGLVRGGDAGGNVEGAAALQAAVTARRRICASRLSAAPPRSSPTSTARRTAAGGGRRSGWSERRAERVYSDDSLQSMHSSVSKQRWSDASLQLGQEVRKHGGDGQDGGDGQEHIRGGLLLLEGRLRCAAERALPGRGKLLKRLARVLVDVACVGVV